MVRKSLIQNKLRATHFLINFLHISYLKMATRLILLKILTFKRVDDRWCDDDDGIDGSSGNDDDDGGDDEDDELFDKMHFSPNE